MDKSWMTIKQRLSSNEYRQGMESFLEFAMANLGPQAEIRCPCIDCVNSKTLSIEVVRLHLLRRGIDSSYKTWVHHGEPIPACHPQKHNDDYHERNECSGDQIGGEVPEDDNHLRDGNAPDFLERYKASKIMKDGGWIDPQCEQLYERMLAMKEDAKELGKCLPTDEEYSMKVLGEARYYFRGMGVGPKPLSSSAREDLQQVQPQMELLCEERDKEREENQKLWEDARIRHEEEREEARMRYEALQREQAQRDEEARARHEALQKELDTFKAILMSQMNGRDNVGSS